MIKNTAFVKVYYKNTIFSTSDLLKMFAVLLILFFYGLYLLRSVLVYGCQSFFCRCCHCLGVMPYFL